MKDIENRSDIELLVNSFYDDVRKDDVIGFIFNRIIGDDWSKHLPIMYSFWETVLLHVASYQGSPIQKHFAVDKEVRLEQEHYGRWLKLWVATVDRHFAGPIAEDAKKRAKLMIYLIDTKVQASRNPGFIQ